MLYFIIIRVEEGDFTEEMSMDSDIQIATLMLDVARRSLLMRWGHTSVADYIIGHITQRAALKRRGEPGPRARAAKYLLDSRLGQGDLEWISTHQNVTKCLFLCGALQTHPLC